MDPAVRPWPATHPERRRVLTARVVTAVLCAAFDRAADDAILAVRRQVLARDDVGHRLPEVPPHRPHLTLAAARVEPGRLSEVTDAAADVAAAHDPIAVPLVEVGGFGRSGALWLGPGEGTPENLRRLQRDADSALTAAGWARAFGERSSATAWVPHCTLATRLHPRRLRALQSALVEEYRPIPATVAALAVIVVGGSGDVALLPLGRSGH